MNWYLKALKNYFNFKYCSRRKEYWYFHIISYIILLLIAFPVYYHLYSIQNGNAEPNPIIINTSTNILYLYLFFIITPIISVTVRRLHDINKSGWWILIILIPFIGRIILLVWLCSDGTNGINKYGPNTKELQQKKTGNLHYQTK